MELIQPGSLFLYKPCIHVFPWLVMVSPDMLILLIAIKLTITPLHKDVIL